MYECPVNFDDAGSDEANRGGLVRSVLVVIVRIWMADLPCDGRYCIDVVGKFTPLISYLVITNVIQYRNKLGAANVSGLVPCLIEIHLNCFRFSAK